MDQSSTPKRKRRYTATTTYNFSECEDGITIPENHVGDEKSDHIKDWQKVLPIWEEFSSKTPTKAAILVRRGIPHEIRGDVWKVISGGASLKDKNPGVFEVRCLLSIIQHLNIHLVSSNIQ
eukprot:TRINITY_DN7265_c0_g1_i1.p1 TRINITY_DN7265_c0_g1~~TRINITY_DN7265_c0_g1_i1.p1  ORF type:complete len:121 (+),score=24.21 TRINITY_DN7265_c0_g1_i1:22-384(+)